MTHINQRRDTAANWASANPILQLGEVGWERNTRKAKQGDGVSPWNSLPYSIEPIPNLALYALLASPVFTGDPKAPTPSTADNDTSIATTAFVKAQGYAPAISPTFTGDPKAPTPATSDNDTSIATTAFVKVQGYATVASPTFTGDPKAPTPTAGDNDTTIATTAFVKAASSISQVQASSALALSGSDVLIPGLTITVAAAGTGTVFVVDIAVDFSAPAAAVGAAGFLYVDGVKFGTRGVVFSGLTGNESTLGQRYVVSGLTAGNHTFTVRASRFGGTGGSAGATHSALTVEVRA